MAVSLLRLFYLLITLVFLLLPADCFQVEPHLCESTCAGLPTADLSFQRGVRYTYRYSTTVTTSLHGTNAGRNGLALDCVVDIDVVSKCHLMMQIRNPQIKRLSPQKEHSVQRLKSLRESLERTRLKFSLQRGKVTALCLQEGEQVWALNIKRALLSMLQTSRTASKQELKKETDVYGTCTSRYERQGAVLLKTRDLKQCQESRLANFWPHSVALSEDTLVQTELHCVQRHGPTVMEEVNCTEAVSVATWSKTPGLLKTQTVSTLLLLRAQPGAPSGADSLNVGVLTDLKFEEEGSARERKFRNSSPSQASQTVRRLCSTPSDLQRTSQEFLQLAFQLRDLTLSQLKMLWQEASFKCRNDWQPLLDALPVCGSENCIVLLTDLMRNKELEEEQAHSFLTTIALTSHPSPQIIDSINALLDVPELRPKALLTGSALVYQLCQKSPNPCNECPRVQTFLQTIVETLKEGCEKPARVTEVLYGLKSVGNAGLPAQTFIPLLNRCVLGHSTTLQLRLAAVQAFRRFPCSADRSVLLQLYRSSQEDPEVRIAAYQQLMRCPDQNVFTAVKITLRNETSSQVGSYVWNHLTNIFRSEDPMKQALIESLPDDIISKDFEAEFLKYSSYSDYTVATGMGIINLETSVIFSPKSFLPRSAATNITVYFYGRAYNLLEVDIHMENAEKLMKNIFGQQTSTSDEESTTQSQKQEHEKEARGTRRKTDDGNRKGKEMCSSSTNSYLTQAKAMLFGRRRTAENSVRCWVAVKVFGHELSMFTCEDLHSQINQLSLSMAGLAVKLLKGHEVQLNHRAVSTADELILPSLSGLPIKMGINTTSLMSLRLKGNVNYRDASHFSLTGYIKPTVYVGLSVRMGVDGALGQAAVDWLSELRSSTSLDGSVMLQEGQDVRVTLNTPEDVMDVISLTSQVFQLSGDHREEIKGPKSRIEKTACTPKSWSKMVGWQLCSNSSYPSPATGVSLPPPGPVHLSLRLLRLDRGLRYYLLEAAYSLLPQRGTWLPREASIHLLLATPQSSIPRDMSLDMAFSPHRLLLRITHPLKTIHIQGQMEQEGKIKSGRLELTIDGVSYYVMGLADIQTLLSEQRTRYHLEAKMAANRHPMILSANVTRELGRKTSFSATVKNVFRDTMSLSVALERRRDSSSRQYSLDADVLVPGVVGGRVLGLVEHKGSVWSSALRLKYGLGGDARHLRHECYASQRMRSETDRNRTYILGADHEFYCSNTAPINHKIHLRHEESPRHVKSSLDMSYGKHWDEINNKCKLHLSQSFKNQSTQNHTSYTLEFSFQVPEKNLNYRTQLLHSHLRQLGSESSTHLKIYNNQMPLVAGLHWKSNPIDPLQRKWEGAFNVDTPWLYIYTAHKLNQLQQHTLQLTSELTCSKWLTIRNLILEGFYRDRGREREARLELYTPAVSYLQTGGWCMVGKRSVKASCSLSSLWSPPLRGDVSLEASKFSHTLQMASALGKYNISIAAALSNVDKVLKKKQVTLRVTLSKPKSSSTELDFEGAVQELRKDKKMYQKVAMLKLRQPFQTFPQNLLLRETFTVDLLKGLYILESKGIFNDSREVIHTVTLGYHPPSPFICSTLIHPFVSDTVPSDSEICVTVSSNQTHKDVKGRLRVGSKERLTFFGRVQLSPLQSSHKTVKVKANFTHQLQLQLPSSALLEGDVLWKPKNNSDFDYQTRGRLRIERQECELSLQFNGTSSRVGLYSSLRHPFKSKLPKTLEVKATADLCAVSGKGSSSVCVRADGKDRVKLDAQMSHFHHRDDRAVGIKMNLSQSLLPVATNLHLNMAANMSSDSVSLHGSYTQGHEALLAQVKGSLKNTRGLQLAVSGDLRHSMASLAVLPPALGLDGALGRSDTLTEGQLRVRVMDTLYRVELRHQGDPRESLDGQEDEGILGKSHEIHDWLCVWSGEENLCVNVSRQQWHQGRGEVYTRLSHSSHLLNATGLPANSSAQMRWALDSRTLSVVAELQAGPEHLKAEFTGGRTEHLIARWECFSSLQHQVRELLNRGLPSSIQTKAHYQSEAAGLSTGLDLVLDDVRVANILFSTGSKNSTALLAISLRQQIKLLQGLIPSSLQMNCTGGATADRLSAHCYGNVSGHPVEVHISRSYRPHRLCYGISLAYVSLGAQAKGCFSPNGQTELRTNLTHSSGLLLKLLRIPVKCGLRLLLRPGPQRMALGVRLAAGSWKTDLNVGLRLERPGLYGWHGLLEYGTHSVAHKAEVTGRVRLKSRCHIWADVSVTWDSFISSLLLSVQCKGVGRLVWVQTKDVQGGVAHKTALTIHGQAGEDGLKGSLGLVSQQDSLQCLWSVLLKDQKAEVSWIFHHNWASVALILPRRVDLQGSGQLLGASFSGSGRLSYDARFTQIDVTWERSTSFRVRLHQNMASTGLPGMLIVSMLTTANRAQFEVDSDACSLLLLTNQHRGAGDRRTSCSVFAQQQCVLMKTVLPPQSSVNISVSSSGSSTNVSTVLQAEGKQRGSLVLYLTRHPSLSVKASVQNSIDEMRRLGFPSRGEVALNVSAQQGVWVGLELGNCYIRGRFVKNKDTEGGQSSYTVSGTNSCPALQGTVLPVFLTLQGFLSVAPCHLMLTSSVRADNRNLSLVLTKSCRPQQLSGSLAHSFPALKSHGLPPMLSIEATSGGSSQAKSLFIKVGTCDIRANRVTESKTQTKWLWGLESKCPLLQAQLNGSVLQDPEGSWAATVETVLKGKRGFLRLSARPSPELSMEGQFSHNLPALSGLPEHGTLRVTSRAGKQQYDTEAQVQMDECAVRASGAFTSQPGLQGSLVYHNNCSVIQGWGSPGRMLASGSLLVSPAFAKSEVSMTIDDAGLQGFVALKKTKDQHEASLNLNHSVLLLKKLGLPLKNTLTVNCGSRSNGSYFYIFRANAGTQMITQEMMVSKASETVRVNGHLRHTVSYLKTVGFPANNSLQVELGSAEGKTLTLQSQFGGHQAGLRVKMKSLSTTKDIRGGMWHSWPWLQGRGVPLKVEGLCSIQGVFSQLQSRAQLTVDGHKLLTSGLNVSMADGRLAVHVSFSPPPSNRTWTLPSLDTAVAAQYKGPLWSSSVDVNHHDWRVRVMGDIGGLGQHGGSKDARITLRHTVQGQTSPTLQVEAWGRLTETQLRCSMAVNPELSSSLALIVQGHHLPHSKDLMVKVVQNIPNISFYLPSQLNIRSQLNQSQSRVAGLVEVLSGRRSLWAQGELAAIGGGYRQAAELKHSYPQLKPLPRNVALRTVYEGRNWTYQVQHGAVWGNQELSLSGLYSAPATLALGNHTLKVHIKCIPRWTGLDVTLERSPRGRLDGVSLGWTRHGRREQVSALSSWSRSEDWNETRLELKQPFSPTLSQLSFHAVSHSSMRGQQSSHQASLSWNSRGPVNVSLSLNKQRQNTSSRGQACAVLSTQQMVASPVEGCVSVGHEGDSYSQNAELRWENKSFKQDMMYQKAPRGVHSLRVNVELDRVSPAPCPSHTLQAHVQTNLKDHLEHTVLLGLCPPQPPLSWVGAHRVNSGEELFYTQSRLSVAGRPSQCSLTLVLTNSSTAQGTNVSLFSESRMGNWSVHVGGNALSWPRGSGLQVQATLDQREKLWLSGMVEGRCLQTTAGYTNDSGLEVLTAAACARTNRTFTLDVQRKINSDKSETLGSLSVGSSQQKLVLKASGCLESLTAVETRLHCLISQMEKRLLERIKAVQHLLTEFRAQSTDGDVLQQLIALPLHASRRIEALLSQTGRGLLVPWQNSLLRRIVTDGLPGSLSQLHHASLLGQQELRRPLATLAGVYQDLKGQSLDALWRQPVLLWTEKLVEALSALLGNPQLKPLVQAGVGTLSVAVDVAGQHTYHWMETRLATALSGFRKRLASVYKFSPSECSVTVSVPLPPIPWSRVSEAGLVETLLEEWLLRPLQTLATIRPTAELYRLKRKLMDGPFIHQALLVADQFVVTFDGHLFELPASCPLLMAQDVNTNPSFTLLLTSDPQNLLLIEMNNSTINIQHNGQVKTNCSNTVTHAFHSDSGVDVRRGSNFVQVSNQNGVSVSCDLPLELCSFTTDGWLHGTSTGLFGTNDNEAGNDFLLPDGSQAKSLNSFFYSWQVNPECVGSKHATQHLSKTTTSPLSCDHLFSSPDSPLSSCFRVVDPGQFLSVCELSSSRAPCRLAAAFVHLCQQNYIPLEVPAQCLKV